MRHIMVATDGSSGADRAVDVAAEPANAVAGDLLIATVAGNISGEEARSLRVPRQAVLATLWKH
jgi:nucleotide-binding universal stress UspA family protein